MSISENDLLRPPEEKRPGHNLKSLLAGKIEYSKRKHFPLRKPGVLGLVPKEIMFGPCRLSLLVSGVANVPRFTAT